MKTTLALILLLASASPGATLQSPPALDLVWEDPAKARIEWKPTWDETYKANVERWNRELDKSARSRDQHAWLLRMRTVRLLRELVRRFPDEREKARAAPLEIAGNFYSCGMRSRANFVLKNLLDRSQGDAELAAGLLARILEMAAWQRPWSIDNGFEWVEFAARRLVALAATGTLPDDHPYVANAWRALAVLRRLQGRYLDAAEALDHLAAPEVRQMLGAEQRHHLIAGHVTLANENLEEGEGRVGLGPEGAAGLHLIRVNQPSIEGESDNPLVAFLRHRRLLGRLPAS